MSGLPRALHHRPGRDTRPPPDGAPAARSSQRLHGAGNAAHRSSTHCAASSRRRSAPRERQPAPGARDGGRSSRSCAGYAGAGVSGRLQRVENGFSFAAGGDLIGPNETLAGAPDPQLAAVARRFRGGRPRLRQHGGVAVRPRRLRGLAGGGERRRLPDRSGGSGQGPQISRHHRGRQSKQPCHRLGYRGTGGDPRVTSGGGCCRGGRGHDAVAGAGAGLSADTPWRRRARRYGLYVSADVGRLSAAERAVRTERPRLPRDQRAARPRGPSVALYAVRSAALSPRRAPGHVTAPVVVGRARQRAGGAGGNGSHGGRDRVSRRAGPRVSRGR